MLYHNYKSNKFDWPWYIVSIKLNWEGRNILRGMSRNESE